MNKKLTMIPMIVAVIAIGAIAVTYQPGQQVADVNGVLHQQSLEELSTKADYAIVGTVEKITPVKVDMPKPSDEPRVYTDVLINVEEDVFNNYQDKQISVRILGGETETLKMNVDFSPEFKIGERVFLFVMDDSSSGYTFAGHNYVAGQTQGAYDLTNGQAKQQYSGETLQKDSLISQVKQFKGIS